MSFFSANIEKFLFGVEDYKRQEGFSTLRPVPELPLVSKKIDTIMIARQIGSATSSAGIEQSIHEPLPTQRFNHDVPGLHNSSLEEKLSQYVNLQHLKVIKPEPVRTFAVCRNGSPFCQTIGHRRAFSVLASEVSEQATRLLRRYSGGKPIIPTPSDPYSCTVSPKIFIEIFRIANNLGEKRLQAEAIDAIAATFALYPNCWEDEFAQACVAYVSIWDPKGSFWTALSSILKSEKFNSFDSAWSCFSLKNWEDIFSKIVQLDPNRSLLVRR